ncbi:unnamed protein product [Lathyrus sativus]|nr:unnamed protein product [Lathyrus sativus]
MALILSFFNCFGTSSNSSFQVSDYAEKPSQSKSSFSEKSEKKKKLIKGAPIVVYHFPVNSYLSRL